MADAISSMYGLISYSKRILDGRGLTLSKNNLSLFENIEFRFSYLPAPIRRKLKRNDESRLWKCSLDKKKTGNDGFEENQTSHEL